MRVLLLTTNPNLGASARTLQEWLLLAREAGHVVYPVLRQEGDLSRWIGAQGFGCHINPMPALESLNPWKWAVSVGRLVSWLAGARIDLIHCYEHDLWPFVWGLRRLLRAPAVCHVHFSIESSWARWAYGGRWRRPDWAIWTSHRQQADCADAVSAVLSPDSQSVVPLGVSLDHFGSNRSAGLQLRRELGVGRDDVVIGAASAFRARKRVDDFIDLVLDLTRKHPHVHGVLAGGEVPGDEEYAAEITRRLEQLRGHPRFHWLGHREPVEPVMQACDIFTSTSDYETFGMSVCEAMACGRPIVGYEGGSVGEVVGPGGILVENRDLTALIHATESLIADATLRRRLGREAQVRVERDFSPRRSFDQLQGIYAHLSS